MKQFVTRSMWLLALVTLFVLVVVFQIVFIKHAFCDRLRYNYYEDRYEYADKDDKLRYNYYEDKYEYAREDDKLKYNYYEQEYSYEEDDDAEE